MWCPERGSQAVVGKGLLRVRGECCGALCGTLYGTQIWYAGVLGMFVVGKSLVGKTTVVSNVVSNDACGRAIPTGIEFTS